MLKQNIKKYTVSGDSLETLVDAINIFSENYEVNEIIDISYFEQQVSDTTTKQPSYLTTHGTMPEKSETVYTWKWTAIITVLKEENIERRLL